LAANSECEHGVKAENLLFADLYGVKKRNMLQLKPRSRVNLSLIQP
jgi:hypothetical protein